MNSITTLAPVSFMNPSSICFLKNGSASGTKLEERMTDTVVPLRFGTVDLAAGAAWEAAGAWVATGAGACATAGAVAAGLAGSAGFAGAAGFSADGAVAPPQAISRSRLL